MTVGTFITFEGGEGAGKSTQVDLLCARLVATGHDVVVTREPGGSDLGEELRALLLGGTSAVSPLVEALLFNAARADHLDKVIRPALAAGRWVLCDRFSDSTRVYQGLAGGVEADVLLAVEKIVLERTQPTLTFIFDLPASEGLKRANNRRLESEGGKIDRFEARDVQFHTRLRDGFLRIAQAEPERCAVIDAGASIDDVAAQVWSAIEERVSL